MTTLIGTKEWGVFKTEVLDELHKAAFGLFKKADPTIPEQIIEAQQKAIIIESIEDRINKLIQQGRLAQEYLKAEPPEEETYE